MRIFILYFVGNFFLFDFYRQTNNGVTVRESNESTKNETIRENAALSKFIDELSFDLENPKIEETFNDEVEEMEEKSVNEKNITQITPPTEIVVEEKSTEYTSPKSTNFVTVIEVKENDSTQQQQQTTSSFGKPLTTSSFKSIRSDYENIDKSQMRNSLPIVSEKPQIPPALPAAKKKTPPK
jgi:hypothetical protein